jgi:phage tail-like protein
MPPANRKTPLTGFLFGFKISDGDPALDYTAGTAFFKSVQGLKMDNEVVDYTEGGVTNWTRKVIGVRKWPNLVLSQGFTGDSKIFMWKYKPKRVNGMVVQLGPKLEEIGRWEFSNGYPVKWTGPDFDANKNEIAIETIEIAHEGLVYVPKDAAPPPPPPPPPPAPPPSPPIDATVNFPTNSSTVPKPNAALDAVADQLKSDPNKKVKIEGDTDSTGSASYNKTLSQQRADAVKKYLIDGGTPAAQIVSSIGYGEDRCAAAIGDNKNDASWRRTKVIDA